ncbi:TetR-like C-terminal domain-containing protein [Desulfoscipio gibsoniae]|uniref:TetR-like C-terminal domain-containing protein n=1 Tax=Desulfoscipio gibsoniae TaxID=102134 RepID=UPI000232A9CF|nr:TetR-like C-terminal domain-containing protein [Desulfoscipio gibsoniae]
MYLYSVINELLIGVINEISCNMKVKEGYKKFIANFYTLAFNGLVIQWMKGGMKENPTFATSTFLRILAMTSSCSINCSPSAICFSATSNLD